MCDIVEEMLQRILDFSVGPKKMWENKFSEDVLPFIGLPFIAKIHKCKDCDDEVFTEFNNNVGMLIRKLVEIFTVDDNCRITRVNMTVSNKICITISFNRYARFEELCDFSKITSALNYNIVINIYS